MSVPVRAALLCACALFLQLARAELRGRCEHNLPCPPRSAPCSSNDDCGDNICCTTSCGQACVPPLYTGCENLKLSSERISRALAAENTRGGRGMLPSIRSPRCRTSDGEFEEIQCDNEIVSSCWCVDKAGFELPGTRAPAAGLVNCTKVDPCAAHTCRMLCPLGFELDDKGCPLCKCRDPCSSITCPRQLACQLEEIACLTPPCPPVPTCKRGRSLQNICPVGEPMLIAETNRPFLCGTDPGKPNCPPLYKCLVDSGHDYGVCCPASLDLQKAGTCPDPSNRDIDCGTPCAHDLECPSMQKCCEGGECGKHCILPHNVTMCIQQKMIAQLLVISEKEGKGYVPQCAKDGAFVSKQCSRNGLVCWCVDTEGNKLRGTMGPSSSVKCSPYTVAARNGARSLAECARALCAGVCEYGYKTGADGCPTCECDDPCAAYPCPNGEECIRVKDADCTGQFCTGYPVCRPKLSYENPCEVGAPATETDGSLVSCIAEDCPSEHSCTRTRKSGLAVCCPDSHFGENSTYVTEINFEACSSEAEALCGLNTTVFCPEGECDTGFVCCATSNCGPVCIDPTKMRLQSDRVDETPTMCEYLRDFDEKMEGTVDGMKLALPAPTCTADGSYTAQQCANGRCWCVDTFGTEIPETSTTNASAVNCDQVRSSLSCLELTCRMGCDYGFELGYGRCPTCRCRDPCSKVTCPKGYICNAVDVACDADYCPPVPACLPKKQGQCPYLVPSNGACEWLCRNDAECGMNERCCPTGCGTACTSTIHQTDCQQRKALALHTAAESGKPPGWTWVPKCKDDGSYETVQCRGSDNTCWCVDKTGNEITGTRSNSSAPNCDRPNNCTETSCKESVVCSYGRKLDGNGCPTCECADPCAEANCKSDEKCELLPTECESGFCTPLVRCAPGLQCPNNVDPLQAPDNSGPLRCGPNAAACPSTHACRFVPHDTQPSVCCPKPREVCFESKDDGACTEGHGINTTRWHFNSDRNRCERFFYHGCSGTHNNFKTKEECNIVCPVQGETVKLRTHRISYILDPVLSPCERLLEKNQEAADKYGKGTFIPKCSANGGWEPVQCMSHIDVCWCVSTRGEPLKGSLVRGGEPQCNFRQARKYIPRDPLDERVRADEVLEELIRQMTEFKVEELDENDNDGLDIENREVDLWQDTALQDDPATISEVVEPKSADTARRNEKFVTDEPVLIAQKSVQVESSSPAFKTKCQILQEQVANGGEGLFPRCLTDGSFSPRQCSRGRCWCVDAAGQRRPHLGPIEDIPAPDPCELTQIETAIIELELINKDSEIAEQARNKLAEQLTLAGAHVPVELERERDTLRLRAVFLGRRAADYAFYIENLVKQDKLGRGHGASGLNADVIRSEYRLMQPAPPTLQREILSESTVSATTSYHTALIVLAATSAFIISVLCVIVMLYRSRLRREPQKAERFLPAAPPVYVLSAAEKAELAKALHTPLPPPPVLPPPQNDEQTQRV